jgi:hypothetical protein
MDEKRLFPRYSSDGVRALTIAEQFCSCTCIPRDILMYNKYLLNQNIIKHKLYIRSVAKKSGPNRPSPDDLCDQILKMDRAIRFVGIANKMGKTITTAYRNRSDHLLTEDESNLSTIESVLRMTTRADLQAKLGKPIYSFTLYEKVKRATILLDNDKYPLLMVSFNIEADHESLIKNKLLPLLKRWIE